MSGKFRKTTRIDMHVHTRGSDGWGSADQILYYATERDLDGIVITDHHKTYTKEGDKVAELCEAAGLKVFRGCEYSTKDGHVLIIGVDVDLLGLGRYPRMQEVIDVVNSVGGVAIPAHPYHGNKYLLGERVLKLKGVRAIESRNGQNEVRSPWENERMVGEVRAWNTLYQGTGGSDAHNPKYVGICYTEFDGEINTEAQLVKALKTGTYRARRNLQAVKSCKGGWSRYLASKHESNVEPRVTPFEHFPRLDNEPGLSKNLEYGQLEAYQDSDEEPGKSLNDLIWESIRTHRWDR